MLPLKVEKVVCGKYFQVVVSGSVYLVYSLKSTNKSLALFHPLVVQKSVPSTGESPFSYHNFQQKVVPEN